MPPCARSPDPPSLSFLPDEFKCPIKEEVALTSGEWEVLARHGSKVPEFLQPLPHAHAHAGRHMRTRALCIREPPGQLEIRCRGWPEAPPP